MHNYDAKNVMKVEIDKVCPNNWNPKLRDTDEYSKIVKSIQVNGFKQPILVRETGNGFEIVDGEQRWRACKELGLGEIYIYNLGAISEEQAKSLTIWTQTQVPFEDLALAPIVVELKELGMAIPYSEGEAEDYSNMLNFDFAPVEKPDDGLADFVIKMTDDQFEVVNGALNAYSQKNGVSLGQALDAITEEGAKHYGL